MNESTMGEDYTSMPAGRMDDAGSGDAMTGGGSGIASGMGGGDKRRGATAQQRNTTSAPDSPKLLDYGRAPAAVAGFSRIRRCEGANRSSRARFRRAPGCHGRVANRNHPDTRRGSRVCQHRRAEHLRRADPEPDRRLEPRLPATNPGHGVGARAVPAGRSPMRESSSSWRLWTRPGIRPTASRGRHDRYRQFLERRSRQVRGDRRRTTRGRPTGT